MRDRLAKRDLSVGCGKVAMVESGKARAPMPPGFFGRGRTLFRGLPNNGNLGEDLRWLNERIAMQAR